MPVVPPVMRARLPFSLSTVFSPRYQAFHCCMWIYERRKRMQRISSSRVLPVFGKRITDMGPGRLCLVVAFAAASLCADDKATYLFGTTVVDSSGLHGRVYYLEPGSERLPDF